MKTSMKIFAVVAFLFVTTTSSMFGQAVTATATANILTALGIDKDGSHLGDLDFGDIVPGASSTEVTIASTLAGTRSKDAGTAVLVASNIGNSAKFDLVGLSGATVNLYITDNTITLNSGGNNMNAILSLSAGTATLTGGAASVYVGGVLTVGIAQAAGTYSNTFEVTAQYQ
jgi:hypothetical protein